jgi:hypothetical protein
MTLKICSVMVVLIFTFVLGFLAGQIAALIRELRESKKELKAIQDKIDALVKDLIK